MTSLKMMVVVAFLLLFSVSANPDVDYAISYKIPTMDDDGIDIEDDGIPVTTAEEMTMVERAPREKAINIIKKVEVGFARTTNVGLTVQKGTSGIIHFRIRVKAVTAEALALKAKLFAKSLTKAQKKELRKLSKEFEGDLSIPWLKLIGIDLKKSVSEKELSKVRSKSVALDKLAVKAAFLLKETVAQKIEVRGTLKAKGVSLIPTTVFSFIRIARVYFEDGSTTLVLSDHPGDTATASKDGSKVVPHEVDSLEII